MRVEAIKNGTYVPLNNKDEGHVFLLNQLESNLDTQLKGVESECQAHQENMLQTQGLKLYLEAPDIYMGAAVMI